MKNQKGLAKIWLLAVAVVIVGAGVWVVMAKPMAFSGFSLFPVSEPSPYSEPLTVEQPVVSAGFSAAPTAGASPLTVTFTIKKPAGAPVSESTEHVDFGDGSMGNSFVGGCAEGEGSSRKYTCVILTHTYTKVGTYTARLISTPFSDTDNSNLAETQGTVKIVVEGGVE